MLDFFSRHKAGLTYIVLVVLLVSTIAAQIPTPQHPSLLASGIYAVIGPTQEVMTLLIRGAQDAWAQYVDLQDVRRENQVLKKELASLYSKNQDLNNRLALVGGEMELQAFEQIYKETYAYSPVEALLIGVGAGDDRHTILLNKGSIDGVKLQQGVIAPTGVVGSIVRVGPTTSLARLISHPDFSIAARLQNSRIRALVRGTGNEACDLLYTRDTDPITIGDRIVTSGLEQIFPRGILVGSVSSLEPGEPPLRKVTIQPSADLRSLEWVIIVQWHEEISDPLFSR